MRWAWLIISPEHDIEDVNEVFESSNVLWWRKEIYPNFQLVYLKGRNHLADLDLDGKIILKYILKNGL